MSFLPGKVNDKFKQGKEKEIEKTFDPFQ